MQHQKEAFIKQTKMTVALGVTSVLAGVLLLATVIHWGYFNLTLLKLHFEHRPLQWLAIFWNIVNITVYCSFFALFVWRAGLYLVKRRVPAAETKSRLAVVAAVFAAVFFGFFSLITVGGYWSWIVSDFQYVFTLEPREHTLWQLKELAMLLSPIPAFVHYVLLTVARVRSRRSQRPVCYNEDETRRSNDGN